MTCAIVRSRQLTDTVVDHKPAVPGQDGKEYPRRLSTEPKGPPGPPGSDAN